MSEFKCFSCFSMFDEVEKTINHLRNEHRIKQKVHEIKCIVNNTCKKKFQTWSGLKKHLLSCSIEIDKNIEQEINNLDLDTCTIPDVGDESIMENMNIPSNKIPVVFNASPERMSDTKKLIAENLKETFHFRMNAGVQRFAEKIENFQVAHNVKNDIFGLVEDLLSETYVFNYNSIKSTTKADDLVFEVLEKAYDCVLDEVKKYNTFYKRNKISEENKLFVKPAEMAIGTHWETKRDTTLHQMFPVHKQSMFQYVSITKTLTSLFLRDDFMRLYCDYNSASSTSRHNCTEGVYKDFCCGEVYKKNQLFRHHPESIQIQLFTDGFEMCDALKSKANLHSQVAFYFAIRNAPPQFAFNLQNIHLVALCNAEDLKSEHTDYNNIWKVIVDDLSSLENDGIIIGDGIRLKGDMCIFTSNDRNFLNDLTASYNCMNVNFSEPGN